MNISKKFWFRLKKNIGYIIFLSILQILTAIKFPGYTFLGTTANAVMKPILGIVGMIGLIFLFTAGDKIEKGLFFNCAPELDEPFKTYVRIFVAVVFLLSFIASIYYFCNKVFLNCSKSYCMLLYIDVVFLYFFLYLSTQKRKN